MKERELGRVRDLRLMQRNREQRAGSRRFREQDGKGKVE